MKVLFSACVFATIGALTVQSAIGTPIAEKAKSAKSYPLQDLSRVAAIAVHLPEQASPVGPLPSDRVQWDKLATNPGAASIIMRAEAIRGKPVEECPDNLYLEFAKGDGNRTRYERHYFTRRNNLDVLMLAEALEWRGRFIDDIRRHVAAVLAEKSWTVPAHDRQLNCFEGRQPIVALFSSQRCWTLAYAATWFRQQLGDELVRRIKHECHRRILDPYLAVCRDAHKALDCRAWWFFGRNNWTSVCHLNCTASALMLIDDRHTRAECLEACERAMPYYFSGFTDDGYCSEGMGYWAYGFGCYTSLVLLARHYTGDFVKLLSDTPKAAVIASYATSYQLEDGISPSFADGGGNPPPFELAEASRLWPCKIPEKFHRLPLFEGMMTNFGKVLPCCAVDRRAFGFRGVAGAGTDGILPMRSVFPEAQVFLMRPAAKGGIAVAIKGGHNNEFHNHNDVGTYAASANGQYLLGDVGGEPYTRRTFSKDRYASDVLNSFGHGVPRVDGKLQSEGRRFAAKVLATDFETDRDMVKLDLKGAYECPKLVRLERTLVYNRINGSFTVRDEVEFSEPAAFDVPFVTKTSCRRDGERWVISGRNAAIEVSVKVNGGPWTWQSAELDDGRSNRKKPERHSVTFTVPVVRASVEFSFLKINENTPLRTAQNF